MTSTISQNSVSGYQIEVTSKRVRQAFQQELRAAKIGVTVDQWVLLQALDKREGLSQLELAQAVFKDQPSVTRIIDLMVEKGLLTRNPDELDRRKFLIFLTQSGKQKIMLIKPLVQEFRIRTFEGIPRTELIQFSSTLNKIFKNIQ